MPTTYRDARDIELEPAFRAVGKRIPGWVLLLRYPDVRVAVCLAMLARHHAEAAGARREELAAGDELLDGIRRGDVRSMAAIHVARSAERAYGRALAGAAPRKRRSRRA